MADKTKNLLRKFLLLLFAVLLAGCGEDSPTRPLDTGPYTISGSVTSASGSALDADSNDPESHFASNNDPASAQTLANPVVLGGYLTAVATGVAGDRCETTADEQDWYRMTLAAGQFITLTIADHDGNDISPSNPDFDLFLMNISTPSELKDSSEGSGRQETIVVAESGEYYLQVYAFHGGSNYVLGVGSAPAAMSFSALSINDDFVPDEVIVRFREPSPGAGNSAQSVTARASALGLVHKSGRSGAPMLYRLGAAAKIALAQSVTKAGGREQIAGNAWQQAKRETIDQIKALRRRTDIVSADLNYIRRSLRVPKDPFFGLQWNAALINLPQAWDLTTGSSGVVVAVLDTGVLMEHPDLSGRLCAATDDCRGYDFVTDLTAAADGSGIDPDPNDPGDKGLPDGSSSFHGTHVAGVIGAAGDNGLGVAGIDWAARLMPVRVLGLGEVGTSYDIMQGVRYAAGLSNDSATLPAKTAHILNLSFGGGGYSQTEQDLYAEVRAKGIIVVAAAGNQPNGIPFHPAAYAGVVAVGAVVDASKALASYSNVGAAIDVVAPGGEVGNGVISTSGNDLDSPLTYDYDTFVGTSASAPHVAGVAALMLAVDPALTPAQFDILLAAGSLTEDLGNDGGAVRNDSFGYGLIDARKAVVAAHILGLGGALPPALVVSPGFLNFGVTTTSLPLLLANAGGGTPTVTSVDFSAVPWISSVTLSKEAPAGSGLGTYSVVVDRSALADGNYSGTITFSTGVTSSLDVTVLLQVGGSGAAAIGLRQVYLIDARSNASVQSFSVSFDPVAGSYHYSFTGVAFGNYRLAASSDLDHDGLICDAGEACGRYPRVKTSSVRVAGDLDGIDFTSAFAETSR